MAFSSSRGPGLLWQLPQPHGLVQAAGQDELAVRRDGHAPDPVGVPEEPRHLLAALDVPQPYRLVVAGRQDALAVRREDGPVQLPRVSLQLPLLPAAQLEDAQHIVHAAGQNELAVWRERHAGNSLGFADELADADAAKAAETAEGIRPANPLRSD